MQTPKRRLTVEWLLQGPTFERSLQTSSKVLQRFVMVRNAGHIQAGYLAGEVEVEGADPLCAVYLPSRDALGGGLVLVRPDDVIESELSREAGLLESLVHARGKRA